MEEKKNVMPVVWTEEQWEHWVYSFAAEIEQENLSTTFNPAEPAEIHPPLKPIPPV